MPTEKISAFRRIATSVWGILTASAIILGGIATFLIYHKNPKVELVGELKPSRIVLPKAMRKDIDKLSKRIDEALKEEKTDEQGKTEESDGLKTVPDVLLGRTWSDIPLLPTWWRFYSDVNFVWTLTIRNTGNKEAQRIMLTIPSDVKVVQIERAGQGTETHTFFKDFSLEDLRRIGDVQGKDEQTIDLKTLQPSEEIIIYAWSILAILQDFRANDFRLSHSEGLGDINRPPSPFDTNPFQRYFGPIVTGVTSALSMTLVLWLLNVGGIRSGSKQPRKNVKKRKQRTRSRQNKAGPESEPT